MVALRESPIFTKGYDSPDMFRPQRNSAYIYGLFEERSEHINSWAGGDAGVSVVQIVNQGRNSI